MNILPYELSTTNDLLTSRAGLICIAEVMKCLDFSNLVNQYFPAPKSNRGFKPSVFVNAVMLMLHEGGQCLDDLRYIRHDKALRSLLGLKQVPESDSLGDWLRRLGEKGVTATTKVNRVILAKTLHRCKRVTLDIDATLSASKNQSAQWTYKKCKGYMPMVGHLVETGQIVATDFREGNVAPADKNLEFIHQCEAALPEGVSLSALRIDAAGYQMGIIDECIQRQLKFAIRARMSRTLKSLIQSREAADWKPLLDQDKNEIAGESVTRVVHSMEQSQNSFSVVIQRRLLAGQQTLDIDEEPDQEVIQCGQYLYRAIAVSETAGMSDSDWVRWYNQRGEHSENRIKELKRDFAAGRMPCQDFEANALYFSLCALAFNLFVLMRMHLPNGYENCRAKTLRWRVYALAGKVVRHGRKIYLKLNTAHHDLLQHLFLSLKHLNQTPQAP